MPPLPPTNYERLKNAIRTVLSHLIRRSIGAVMAPPGFAQTPELDPFRVDSRLREKSSSQMTQMTQPDRRPEPNEERGPQKRTGTTDHTDGHGYGLKIGNGKPREAVSSHSGDPRSPS